MKISANEIRIGNILRYKGDLWQVTKTPIHVKPGKGVAYIQLEVKNMRTNTKTNQRFSSTYNVEKAFLERKEVRYLYVQNNDVFFMCIKSFEQFILDKNFIGLRFSLLTEGLQLEIEFYNDIPINIKWPSHVIVKIKYTIPTIKSATVTSSYKPALLTNGLKVMVPSYLVSGERIVIKSNDLTFIEKAK